MLAQVGGEQDGFRQARRLVRAVGAQAVQLAVAVDDGHGDAAAARARPPERRGDGRGAGVPWRQRRQDAQLGRRRALLRRAGSVARMDEVRVGPAGRSRREPQLALRPAGAALAIASRTLAVGARTSSVTCQVVPAGASMR